jgi:hypothetical protein
VAIRGRNSSSEKIRATALKWSALKYELDIENDYARPDNTPPERAFQVLNSGFDLAVEIARSGIPSVDRRTQKRGAKWMIEDIPFREGPIGVNMLAIGMPAVLARTGGDLLGAIDGPTASVEQHRKLEASVSDFYALPANYNPIMVAALAEYDVMETKRPRPQVFNGLEPGTRYSQALVDGEDPDKDPELVAEQQRWARDFFIAEITRSSCELMLGNDYEKLKEHIVRMVDLKEGADEYRERLLAAWMRGSETYREYAIIDEGS